MTPAHRAFEKAEKAFQKAQQAREIAEQHLRGCELEIEKAADVLDGYESATLSAVRSGKAPEPGLAAKRREYRDLTTDLKAEAAACRTVISERKDAEQSALIEMERARREWTREQATEVAEVVRTAFSALRAGAGQLDELQTAYRRSRDRVRYVDHGPVDPAPLTSVLEHAEIEVLKAL